MQKKQVLQFAALLALILALAGAYAGIQSYKTRQEEEKNRQEAAATITLTSFGPDSVTAISYDVGTEAYAFEKDGGEWKDAGTEEITLDQDAFKEFLQTAGAITAGTKVQAQEGEDYGFGDPARTVTVTTVNGTSTLTFGMKNEMLGQYYLKTSESSNIYLVEEAVFDVFGKTAKDFAKTESDTDTDRKDTGPQMGTDTDADTADGH